jgi:hypothetical protein
LWTSLALLILQPSVSFWLFSFSIVCSSRFGVREKPKIDFPFTPKLLWRTGSGTVSHIIHAPFTAPPLGFFNFGALL